MAQDVTALDEPSRLAVLRSYEILDSPPEPAFDRLAKLAAQICGTPYAAITFVNGARQFFKSKVGFTHGETPAPATDFPPVAAFLSLVLDFSRLTHFFPVGSLMRLAQTSPPLLHHQ